MGNKYTMEGKIIDISVTTKKLVKDPYDGYRISIFDVSGNLNFLYLENVNQKYATVLKKLKKHESYKFLLGSNSLSCYMLDDIHILLDVEDTDEYMMTIKILDFIDLSQHDNTIKNLHEIIYTGCDGPRLVTNVRDNLDINGTYEVAYKFMGVVNYYSLKTFKKVNRGYVKIES